MKYTVFKYRNHKPLKLFDFFNTYVFDLSSGLP
jgi:hypothetical protein